MTKRTSLKLTDKRQRKLDRASEIVADGPHDDPPMSVVIDAALTNLIEHEKNLDDARKEVDPQLVKKFNTSVIRIRYRTSVESDYR
jgi:hypothetical protein